MKTKRTSIQKGARNSKKVLEILTSRYKLEQC